MISMKDFTVLSSWQSHCESSLHLFDECRLSAKRPPTLRPCQSTWAATCRLLSSTPTATIYHYYSAQRLILNLPFLNLPFHRGCKALFYLGGWLPTKMVYPWQSPIRVLTVPTIITTSNSVHSRNVHMAVTASKFIFVHHLLVKHNEELRSKN